MNGLDSRNILKFMKPNLSQILDYVQHSLQTSVKNSVLFEGHTDSDSEASSSTVL